MSKKKKMTPAQKAAARWSDDERIERSQNDTPQSSAQGKGQKGKQSGSSGYQPSLWGLVISMATLLVAAAFAAFALSGSGL